MSYDQKNMNGALFVNDRKEKDSHPDYQGSVTINNQQYWLSGWKKATRDGKKYLSLALKPKMAQEHQGAPRNPPAREPTRGDDAFGDEKVPF